MIYQRAQSTVAPLLLRTAPSIAIRATWRLAPRVSEQWVETRAGQFYIDPKARPIDSALYYHGTYEAGTLRFLEDTLKPGDVFFDVGAYIGYISVFAARLGAVVHAVEPDPATADVLRKNIAKNQVDVTVHEAAIGSRDGQGKLHQAENPAANTMAVLGNSVPVAVRSIDSLSAETGPPAVVKLDTEGWEMQALEGAADTLNHRPYLVVETSRISGVGHQSPILGYLANRDYQAWKLRRGKDSLSRMVPVKRLPRHDNLFFIPNERSTPWDG